MGLRVLALRLRQKCARVRADDAPTREDQVLGPLDLGAGDLHLLVEKLQRAGLVAGDALGAIQRGVDVGVHAGQLLVQRQRVGLVAVADLAQHALGLGGDGIERSDVDRRALRTSTLDLLDLAQLVADLGDQRRQVGLRGADVVLGVLDGGEVGVGDVDGAGGGGQRVQKRALAPGRLVGKRARFAEGLFRLVQRRFGQVHVVHDGLQDLRRVLALQLRQRLTRGLQARPDVHGAREDLLHLFGRAHEHAAHLVELGGLVAQRLLRAAGRGDDVHQHRALFGFGFRDGVVKLLVRCKRALQGGGGLVHRGGERAHAVRAELGGGKLELLLALGDGLVGGDQRVARDLLQRRRGQTSQRIGVCRVEGFGRFDLLGLLLLRALARRRVHAAARQRRHAETACEPASAAACAIA